MSCTVAISNSPVFSPTNNRLFCKTSSFSSSPESVSLTHSPSSPSLKLRIQKTPSGLIRGSNDDSATFLKRKRPTKLDIPIASLGFGGAPVTPKSEEEWRSEDGDVYSVYCKRGRRDTMEDRYSAVVNNKQGFFGIFDGHGGVKAAEFAAENLSKNVLDEVEKRGDEEIKECVTHAYLKTDNEFLKEDVRGGTCCVTALIRKGVLVVSNAGDCRAVISNRGVAEALTSDHRPSRQDEKERIESLGGYVDCRHGVWRILGSLAVSRGIGDRHLKQWVTAEPETQILPIKPDFEFLVLASDGLWDKVSNQEAIDIARPLCVGTDKPEPLFACKKLVDLSVSRGSTDDTSVMIIRLKHFC